MHSGLDTMKKAIKCRCGGVGAQSAVLVTCMFTKFGSRVACEKI
jgi:hypothetical protein